MVAGLGRSGRVGLRSRGAALGKVGSVWWVCVGSAESHVLGP